MLRQKLNGMIQVPRFKHTNAAELLHGYRRGTGKPIGNVERQRLWRAVLVFEQLFSQVWDESGVYGFPDGEKRRISSAVCLFFLSWRHRCVRNVMAKLKD
jgi:hypothetical protein